MAVPQRLDHNIVGGSFDPTVPASIVFGTVPVVFTIRLIVFLVVGHEIVERETIVTSDEIDALFRFAPLVPIDVGACDDAVRDSSD